MIQGDVASGFGSVLIPEFTHRARLCCSVASPVAVGCVTANDLATGDVGSRQSTRTPVTHRSHGTTRTTCERCVACGDGTLPGRSLFRGFARVARSSNGHPGSLRVSVSPWLAFRTMLGPVPACSNFPLPHGRGSYHLDYIRRPACCNSSLASRASRLRYSTRRSISRRNSIA